MLLAIKKLKKLIDPNAAIIVTTLEGIKGNMRNIRIKIKDFRLFLT